MRERLQRRKKSPAEPSDQPAPPPLQPAYFDADQAPAAASEAENSTPEISAPPAPVAQNRPVRARQAAPSPEEPPSEDQAAPSQRAPGNSPAGRSRRRRGGRGRGGRGREQAVAQAFAPAAVKGSIPELPVEPVEGEMPDAEADGQTAEPVIAAVPAPPAPAAVGQRPPKGVVVLAIGLPGSGKSSWF